MFPALRDAVPDERPHSRGHAWVLIVYRDLQGIRRHRHINVRWNGPRWGPLAEIMAEEAVCEHILPEEIAPYQKVIRCWFYGGFRELTLLEGSKEFLNCF